MRGIWKSLSRIFIIYAINVDKNYNEGVATVVRVIFSCVLCLFLLVTSVTASNSPKYVFVHINQEQFSSTVGEASPFINKEGRVMVPVRIVTYFNVSIDDLNQDFKQLKVSINLSSLKFHAVVGDKTFVFNDKKMVMDSAPVKVRESIFVPLRATAEAFGGVVMYEHSAKKVVIQMEND